MKMPYLLGLILTTGAGFALGWVLRPVPPVAGDASGLTALKQNEQPSVLPGQKRSPEELAALRELQAQQAEAEPFVSKYLRQGVLGVEGMEKAMAELLRESDPVKMNQMMAELLARLTPENAEAAMTAITKLGSRDPSQMFLTSLFASTWGRMDGEKALEFTRKQTNGRIATMGSAAALSGWAATEPDNAIAWLEEQEDAPQKMAYTMGLVGGLARSDPDKATEYLSSVDESNPMRGRYVEMILSEQWKEGVTAATDWAEGLEDEKLRSEAFEDLANRYTQDDPAKAADWITARAEEPWARNAVNEVADEWAEKDPAAAVDWALTLPEESQKGAMAAALKEWTESDPTTASEYLAGMEDSPVKDRSIAGFTEQLSREDPQSAVAWAETIQDNEVRTEALTQAAQQWMRQDQEAASAWLQTSGLPEDVQAKVTEPPRQGFNLDAMRSRFGFGD